jgi:hypothetical protein
MKNLHNFGKKADVEAFLLIIAVPLIIISILAFYFFAADELSIGQQSQIEANLAIIKLDEGLAGLKIPPDINAKQMSTMLNDFLAKNKYKTILPPGMQQETCTGDITCNIMVKSILQRNHHTNRKRHQNNKNTRRTV